VNGEVDFTDSTSWKEMWEAKGGGYIEPPGPLKRYLLKDFTWNLLVSNWSPDYPAWSQQALEFYELVHGEQQVEGIVAVDLVVLERLLGVTGPVTLEVEGHGRVTFDKANAVLELERLTRQPFEPTDDRKSVIGDLAEELIARLLRLPSEQWGEAIEVVRRLGAERHVQLLSFDPAEQTVIRDVRWDGRVEEGPADYLMLSETSVLSTKLNLIIQPDADYRVDISPLGDARHELRLHYRNPLPEWQQGKDPALVKALMLGGVYGGYLRIITPRGATAFSAEIDGATVPLEDAGNEGGKDWFGVFMQLPAGETKEVVLRWVTPLATRSTGGGGYELYLQKQPGTPGMCLKLDISRAGKPAGTVKISGGSRDGQRICLTTDVQVSVKF
jgi:hypothetical protein